MKAHADRRRGGAALVALVGLSVMGLVVAGLLKVSMTRAAQVDRIERECQARWLVEAGLERAFARARVDGEYRGETWTIPAESLGGRSAVVEIEVEVAPVPEGEAGVMSVTVRADYPADGPPAERVRRSKSFRIMPALHPHEDSGS